MNLKGLSVLIDGYNLGLKSGTGIKTYTASLINGLSLLGADVNVLFGSNKKAKDPILGEVLLYDVEYRDLGRLKRLKYLINSIIKTGTGLFKKASVVTTSHNIVVRKGFDDSFLNSIGIFNFQGTYEGTKILYDSLGITSTVSIPKKIDVWHTTYPLPVKVKRAKKITTIHDLVPLRLPYTTLDDKQSFFKTVKDSIKNSSIIITVSEHSKKDILKIFDINPDKIHVTYQPITLKTSALDENKIAEILKKYSLEFREYLLFVGALEPKKNIGRLIDAYLMIDTYMPLVIVGKKGWLWKDEIEKKNLKNVRILERVSNSELKSLYSAAYCFVFPSIYEGFGLPALEAMSFGCPVITSNVSSLPEVCGDAALYVDPYDVSNIKDTIRTLLYSPELRDKLSEAGEKRAELFSVDKYVKKLYDVYSKFL